MSSSGPTATKNRSRNIGITPQPLLLALGIISSNADLSIPIQRAGQPPDCGRFTQHLFGHLSNIAQRQRARKKIVIAWTLQDEASGQVGIQEEHS
jgi:hypothetical protein